MYIKNYTRITQQVAKFIDEIEGDKNKRLEALIEQNEKARKAKWDIYKKQLDKKHQGRLSFKETIWDFGQREIEYVCVIGNHGKKRSDLYNLLHGHGCPGCAGNDRLDGRIEEAKSFAKSKGGDCHSKIYINTDSPLLWSFDKDYFWLASYDSVVKRNSWSPWHTKNHAAFVQKTINRLVEGGYRDYARQSLSKYLEVYPEMTKRFKL